MTPLISAQNISKSFSGKRLFSDISLVINEGERLVLIGSNGAGKSTLLKILAELTDADEGIVSRRQAVIISVVSQEHLFSPDATAHDIVGLRASEDPLHREGQIAKALGSCGFIDSTVRVGSLSGGWLKRLAIAQALVNEPELVFFDEPTNHLDIEGILWLEELIQRGSFSSVCISHDRYFIEKIAKRVIELDQKYPGGYLSSEGSYSDFLDNRAAYLEQREQNRVSLASKVRRESAWLRQGAKARTTKSKHRIEEAGKLITELKEMPRDKGSVNLDFAASSRRTKELLAIRSIEKSFGDKKLFSQLSLVVSPGMRIGIVGPNGSGKSTLLKTLLGTLTPDRGEVTPASTLRLSFFDQSRSQLNREESVQHALCGDGSSVVFQGREIHATGWAAKFLLRPDQLKLPVGSLSGGEQARVLLARIMREPTDLLIFDEPTNDLDIDTLNVLEESLIEYPGAILIVTHDRYLLDRVATHVIGLSGNGESLMFASYQQWEESRRQKPTPKGAEEESPKQKQKSTAKVRFSYSEQREWDSIEAAIELAEEDKNRIAGALNAPENAANAQRLAELCGKLAESEAKISSLYTRWEELSVMQASFPRKT